MITTSRTDFFKRVVSGKIEYDKSTWAKYSPEAKKFV